MSKIGPNSMKKWPFFAIILPWMTSYGPEISFLLVFSARDDLVKVSWKSDAQKCQNEVTPLTLTSWVKVPSPFGCWCFHLIKNSSFANLLCCRGGLDWQMVCLFRKPQNGCGVTIFSNNKTKHLTSCCSENDTQDIKVFMAYSLPVSFSPFIK